MSISWWSVIWVRCFVPGEGVASLLEHAPDVELVGQAATGNDAVELVSSLQPDIVLMDLQMPGIGGVEATRAITTAHPSVGVVMLTMCEDDDSVFAASGRGHVASGDRLARPFRSQACARALQRRPAHETRACDYCPG